MNDQKRTYVAAEPVERSVFFDANERPHGTREEAIAANFSSDLRKVLEKIADRTCDPVPPCCDLEDFVRRLCDEHEDMVRIILGDRDST